MQMDVVIREDFALSMAPLRSRALIQIWRRSWRFEDYPVSPPDLSRRRLLGGERKVLVAEVSPENGVRRGQPFQQQEFEGI